MKAIISLACLVTHSFSLNAQITATLHQLPNGLDEVRIRNNSASSLAAFIVTVNQRPWSGASSRAPYVVYSDPLIEPETKPLLANEERVVMARGGVIRGSESPGRRHLEEPIVTAGIFADGVTTGDPALLARLVLRRSNMLMAVETTIETLADAGRRNIPRSQLIKQFRSMADSVNRWYVPPEQQVVRSLYHSIIGKLMSLPEGELGTPFPPSPFVEEETALLNRQKVTLLESQPSLLDATLITAR